MIEGDRFEGGPVVAAVTGRPRVAEVRLGGLDLDQADASEFFTLLDALLDEVAGLHQFENGGRTDVAFHIPVEPEGKDVLDRLGGLARDHGGTIRVDTTHAAVSVVGSGILDAPSVAARAHAALAAAGIRPASLLTGNLSLTFLVPRAAFTEAQNALHREFLEER